MPFTDATKNLDENVLNHFTSQATARYTQLGNQGEAINKIINGLEMEWKGPAHTAFNNQYRRWQEGYNNCLEQLAYLTRNLVEAADTHIENETGRDISIQGSDFGAARVG